MYHIQIHIYVNFKLCYNPIESKQEGKWKFILRAYPPLQHCVVAFRYLKIIKKQTIKFTNLTLTILCYITDRLRGHFDSVMPKEL